MTGGGQFCMEVVDYSAVCGGIGVRGFVESLDFKENLAFFERLLVGKTSRAHQSLKNLSYFFQGFPSFFQQHDHYHHSIFH